MRIHTVRSHSQGGDALMEDNADRQYQVLVNHEEQYSLWPVDKDPPPGWQSVGPKGSREACLEFVEKVWIDMRPLSLRDKQ